MGSDFRWKIVAAHKRKYCYSSKFHNSLFSLFNQADCELHWVSQFSVSIRWVAQAVSRWQMSRAQLKWLQSNAAQTKATAKKLQNTPMRSGKFIITMKHFVRSKCDANSVVPCTFYIYVFIFTLPKGKILMIVLLFSLFLFNSFYFYIVCTTYQKHKLGRYFTRMNGPNRTKRNTNGNLNEDLLLIHCTTKKKYYAIIFKYRQYEIKRDAKEKRICSGFFRTHKLNLRCTFSRFCFSGYIFACSFFVCVSSSFISFELKCWNWTHIEAVANTATKIRSQSWNRKL